MATYVPAGPTLSEFHNSDARFRLIMGPIGSGKSTAGLAEIIFRAGRQAPDERGVRTTSWVVVRNTFGDLDRTTIPSWKGLLNFMFGEGTFGVPMRRTAGYDQRLMFKNAADGTVIDAYVLFLSLDGEGAIGKLLSLQVTGAFVNECYLIEWPVIQELASRLGRSASMGRSPFTWSGIWMDTNPPPDTNWVFQKVEEEKPEGLDVFKQPPAVIKKAGVWEVNPDAENMHNLDKGGRYYLDLIEDGAAEDWISVRMGMQYGVIKEGALVIDEYSEAVHCPEESFGPDVTIPKIYVGIDFGVWASVAFMQVDNYGRWRVFAETTLSDTNTAAFARNTIMPACRQIMDIYQKTSGGQDVNFDRLFTFTGDPAGRSRSSKGPQTDFDILEDEGIKASASWDLSNNYDVRREVLNRACRSMSGGMPSFQISRDCKHARLALGSRYVYRKVNKHTENGTVFKMEPDKNEYSHSVDAIIYGMMGAGEGRDIGTQHSTGPIDYRSRRVA